MKIATILFTYNRSKHTRQTLDALKANTVLPQKLFIFQDGLKDETNRDEWEKVNQIIEGIDWCETNVIVSECNKGLAESIVSGINRAFEEFDAVIVLEDDCVAHPMFMKYTTDCLYKYKDEKKVFAVNGYSWLAEIEANGADAYFCGRTGSWGWATWKDRWELYEKDYMLLREIKSNEVTYKQFLVWGRNLESYLKNNIDGKSNSWLVFWALQCIKRGGFCVTPYHSLIKNIGNDGSGFHAGAEELVEKLRDWNNLSELVLPDEIEFPANCEDKFSDLFRWTAPEVKLNLYNRLLRKWIELLQQGKSITKYMEEKNIETIAIWGRGEICKLLLQELLGKVRVKNIIVSKSIVKYTSDGYDEIPMVEPNDISEEVQLIIVIPTYDIEQIRKSVDNKHLLVGLDEILDLLVDEGIKK